MRSFYMGRFGNIPPIVKNLIIINVVVLIVDFLLRAGLGISLTRPFALFYFESGLFRPYQYVTYMFMHAGLSHIFFNMFALWMFGKALEGVWGSKRFLVFYLVTGIGAAACHTFVNWIEFSAMAKEVAAFSNTPSPELLIAFARKYTGRPSAAINNLVINWSSEVDNQMYITQAIKEIMRIYHAHINIPTVGASGAVYGVLLGFGMLFPNTQIFLLFPPIPIRAKYLVMFYGGLELYLGFSQPGSNIAHFAHLGGMLFGFILIKFWNQGRSNFY